MKGKDILKGMNDIDENIIEETSKKKVFRKIKLFKIFVPIAACFAIIMIGVVSLSYGGETLYKNGNLKVKEFELKENEYSYSNDGDLAFYTEEEIFNKYNTDIFRGVVEKIDNIQINFGGEIEYGSIVTIRIDEVYRGNIEVGQSVTILLPAPIDINGYAVTDTNTISKIKHGTTGIFMPLVLDDKTSLWEQNDISLDKREIVDYGILDGERYCFLETENGLVFDKNAFKSINNAVSLDEIEDYIDTMIK